MTDEKIPYELIARISLEISERFKTIIKIFPKNDELSFLLRQLASSSIHLALFMKDLNDHKFPDEKMRQINGEKEFLENCGCKDE